MANNAQRSFAAGELSPALYARADLARYAIGLRTCRNMVVMRAGGATKRPGTAFVSSIGSAAWYTLTLTTAVTVEVGALAEVVALLKDASGTAVTTIPVTFVTDDGTIATVASGGPLSGLVGGVATGTTNVRATVPSLGLVSNNCVVTVQETFVIHEFTTANAGNWVVTANPNNAMVEVLIVAGGGSGGSVDGTGVGGGGGGAGEVVYDAAVTVPVGTYPIGVGGGGPHNEANHSIPGQGAVVGNTGGDSTGFGITAKGGGGGGGGDATLLRCGRAGGSGGGAAASGDWTPTGNIGGVALAPNNSGLPSGSSDSGHSGGDGNNSNSANGAGGGGATAVGLSGGGGGDGLHSDMATYPTGTQAIYGKGGDGVIGAGANATANSGDGGQGGGQQLNAQGGDGAGGIVLIRYPLGSGIVATGGTITEVIKP